MAPSYLRVGQVRGAHGVRGAVKVLPLTDHEERFAPGSELRLAGAPAAVEWARPLTGGGLVVKVAGVDDRTRAEGLLGSYFEVPEAEAKPLPPGAWYHHQLVGLAVVSEDGRELGRIEDVLAEPANDVWVVAGPAGRVLVPATKDAVVEVDLEAARVTVADWLLRVEDA